MVLDLLLSISLVPRDLAQMGVLVQGAGYLEWMDRRPPAVAKAHSIRCMEFLTEIDRDYCSPDDFGLSQAQIAQILYAVNDRLMCKMKREHRPEEFTKESAAKALVMFMPTISAFYYDNFEKTSERRHRFTVPGYRVEGMLNKMKEYARLDPTFQLKDAQEMDTLKNKYFWGTERVRRLLNKELLALNGIDVDDRRGKEFNH